MSTKLEREFQTRLIRRLEYEFPGCVVLVKDPRSNQGIPDLIVLYADTWFALECKRFEKAAKQPNQEWYVNHFDEMGFAAFIWPENEDEVIHEIQQSLGARR